MKPSDLFAIAKYLAPGVLHTVTSETGPIAERVAGIEARLLSVRDGAPGRDGRDAPEPDVEAIARRAADLIPVPKDGRDAAAPDMELLADLIVKRVPPPKDGIDGADGKDVDPELVLTLTARITELTEQAEALRREMPQLVATEVAKAMASIQIPKDGTNGVDGKDGADGRDGKDAEVDLDALALKAAELIPTPKDGTSITVKDVAPLIAEEVRSAVAAIPPAKDGEPGPPVDPATVEAMVVDHVTRSVAALPTPKDGQSVTVEDVAPLIATEVQKAVGALPPAKDGEPGRDGKDGVGFAGIVVSKDHTAIATLSDGTMRDLGPWPRDGAQGERGADGRDGKDGKDGADGLGIEDFDVIQDHERQFTLRWANGDRVKEKSFTVPVTIYRGIWDRDRAYEVGDQITYAGSQWIAKSESVGKQPGTNEGGPCWQLCVKKGNDGKPGQKGADGKNGRDASEVRKS